MKSFCRTCFKETMDNTSIPLDLVNRNKYQLLVDMLRYCVPDMNLGAVPDAKLCKECVATLKITYKFKIKCREAEGKINKRQFNTIERLMVKQENDSVETSKHGVCRICLVDVDSRFIVSFGKPFYKRKLTICVPEMDLLVTPVINLCKDCYTVLDTVYKFKMKCLVVEKNIKEYLQLHGVMDFTKLSVWCGIFVKNEMNNLEVFTIKQEEVDLNADEIMENSQKDVANFTFVPVKVERFENRRRSRNQNKFKCSQCQYSTMQKFRINSHIRTHAREKPFKCYQCSYETVQKSNLERHIATHSDEKPFTCSQCSYSTKQMSTLQGHLRTHTGEKPFKCSVCGLTFAHRRTYKIHILAHVDKRQLESKTRLSKEQV